MGLDRAHVRTVEDEGGEEEERQVPLLEMQEEDDADRHALPDGRQKVEEEVSHHRVGRVRAPVHGADDDAWLFCNMYVCM